MYKRSPVRNLCLNELRLYASQKRKGEDHTVHSSFSIILRGQYALGPPCESASIAIDSINHTVLKHHFSALQYPYYMSTDVSTLKIRARGFVRCRLESLLQVTQDLFKFVLLRVTNELTS